MRKANEEDVTMEGGQPDTVGRMQDTATSDDRQPRPEVLSHEAQAKV